MFTCETPENSLAYRVHADFCYRFKNILHRIQRRAGLSVRFCDTFSVNAERRKPYHVMSIASCTGSTCAYKLFTTTALYIRVSQHSRLINSLLSPSPPTMTMRDVVPRSPPAYQKTRRFKVSIRLNFKAMFLGFLRDRGRAFSLVMIYNH